MATNTLHPVPTPGPIFAELFGSVTGLNRTKNYGADAKFNRTVDFTVHTPQSKKNYRCICTFFCPLQEGDQIYAICELETDYRGNQLLKMTQPPFVQIGTNKDTIIKSFIKCLKGSFFSNVKAYALYEALIQKAIEGEETKKPEVKVELGEKVAKYLAKLASIWRKTQDDGMLKLFEKQATADQMKKLLFWWHKNRSLRQLYLMGLTNREIRACKMPLDQIYEACLTNPYKLYPLKLEKCTEILGRQNRVPTDEDLYCAQIVRKVYDYYEERGWIGAPSKNITAMFPDCIRYRDKLKQSYGLIMEYQTIYLPYPHRVETFLVEVISRTTPITEIKDVVFTCDTLDEDQKEAVRGTLRSRLSIITGGPGTGKTKVIGEIINNCERKNENYAVVSFTGKAVSRIREVVKRRSPSTMHRMIVKKGTIDAFKHLIIDEVSMVTIDLLYEFLNEFPGSYRITLIGDVNQLPAIGCGFIGALLKSGRVPVYRLTHNHRFGGAEDGIHINAQLVLGGRDPDPENPEPFDFMGTPNFTMLEGDITWVKAMIGLLVKQGFPSDATTIITPYNNELALINHMCQQTYTGTSPSVTDSRGITWAVGDRVVMNTNMYCVNLYNGEEFRVTEVNGTTIVITTQDGAKHSFKLEPNPQLVTEKLPDDPDDEEHAPKELTVLLLNHAFVYSIHKSQGSEWDYVILYVPPHKANASFLNRNLIYTAITRAKKAIWMVGDIEAIKQGAMKSPQYQHETLSIRLSAPIQVDMT